MNPIRSNHLALITTAALFVPGAPALADTSDTSLRLDMAEAFRQPADTVPATDPSDGTVAGESAKPVDPPARERRFGRAGSRWWSIGSGIAYDFDEDTDVNLHGIYSVFLTDELEFGVEAAGWYFDQLGDNTGGLSGSMIFRWHFWHWGGDDGFRSTFFGDAGIGLLAGFDDVPDGGTSLNFLPRLGVGYTHALTEDEIGARLTLGLRWHHISNARIEGEERNPARDSLMIYAEIQFPF
jgi:hypothetical protein